MGYYFLGRIFGILGKIEFILFGFLRPSDFYGDVRVMNVYQDTVNLMLYFLSYSLLGWLIETFFKSVRAKKFVNSGFLSGPFCPIYGFGALLVIQLQELISRTIPTSTSTARTALFIILAIVGTSVLEYLTGLFLERLFKRKWWDYSEEWLNIQGRICLKYSLCWGILGYLTLKFIHPPLTQFLSNVQMEYRCPLAVVAIVYFGADFLNSSMKNALKVQKHVEANSHWLTLTFSWRWMDIFDKVKNYLGKKWEQIYDVEEYTRCVGDLINHDFVQEMKRFNHHHQVTLFEHSMNVAFSSFLLARVLGLDYKAVARGALLHDLFLYDWKTTKLSRGKHAFVHPHLALSNALLITSLNEVETDIILKHMFPLTWQLPAYKESWLVCLIDKCCACAEIVSSVFRSKGLAVDNSR